MSMLVLRVFELRLGACALSIGDAARFKLLLGTYEHLRIHPIWRGSCDAAHRRVPSAGDLYLLRL